MLAQIRFAELVLVDTGFLDFDTGLVFDHLDHCVDDLIVADGPVWAFKAIREFGRGGWVAECSAFPALKVTNLCLNSFVWVSMFVVAL